MKRAGGVVVAVVLLAGCSSASTTLGSDSGNGPLISTSGSGPRTIAVTVPAGTKALIFATSCHGVGFMSYTFSDGSTAADHIACNDDELGLGGGRDISGWDQTSPATAQTITITTDAGVPWRFTLWTRNYKPDPTETFIAPSSS